MSTENKYQFKGTQGVWEYLKGDDNVNDTEHISGSIVGGPDRYYLARIWNDITRGESAAEANAHLIAAAPELLQACVDALNLIEIKYKVNELDYNDYVNHSEQLKSAIHKALNIED